MKILFKIVLLFLISCNTSNQKKELTTETAAQVVYKVEDVLIKTQNGATISAMIVQHKDTETPKPVILQYTIYVRDKGRDIKTLKELADRGYVAVIAYTRGKRFSPDEIYPYEHVAEDSYDVIDWVSKQKWCNGSIGMFGGSYNGFSQWAATKKIHPALKTIVPYVANRPGKGLPIENNVFITPNYSWSLYVGNNKYLDTIVGNDRQRFRQMQNKWWESGVAFKKIDSIDGTPNKYFQRWIQHPSFDEYWQKMTPYKTEFANINIPILSIDGYYNDSQNSSLSYVRDHYTYNTKANHYVIIGPYGHFGAQRKGDSILQGYKVDKGALIDTKKITYQWLDYILKKGDKPQILKDKINYQVMGASEWRGAPSIDKMSNDSLRLYLTKKKSGAFYALHSKKPINQKHLYQEVDFKDRETGNNDYYPDPIIRDDIDTSNGFNFISKPLTEEIVINGSFSGKIMASINKKDMDIGVTLYELRPDGTYFHLSYFLGRASYAKDDSKRNLLTPNTKEVIPFINTHLVSKKLEKGSRLVVYLNVNKNSFSPLNYGTGKAVMDETILDAKEPLKVKWYNDSFVTIPIWKE
ncbi:CocE/NonD family hydrolase [Aquimarina aquimarini]|uniref:CocE/NonD family hydrolase n=1 Tax=Aquimarina aquimarini TaxID=1191734 RepID=UPI000D560D56|nr:CocE/NonD family hydrolase [Aquimarina aquimarini]